MDKITRKTSFEHCFPPISDNLITEQVKAYHLHHYTKKLFMPSFLKALLYAQLHETERLQALSDCFFSEALSQTTNLESISFLQLGRRLNQVPTEFFQAIFLHLVSQIHQKTDFEKQRKTTTPLKIIDLSTLPLIVKK